MKEYYQPSVELGTMPSLEALEDMNDEVLREFIAHYTSILADMNESVDTQVGESPLALSRSVLSIYVSISLMIEHRKVWLRVKEVYGSKYDLIANICHDSSGATQNVEVGSMTNGVTATKVGPSSSSTSGERSDVGAALAASSANKNAALNNGSFRVHLVSRSGGAAQWYELQDLHVSETIPQLVGLSESSLLVYEKKE